MTEYKILLIDDDQEQISQFMETLAEVNKDDELAYTVKGEVCTNERDAAHLLYTNNFDGLIVDLSLKEGEETGTEEELSGNVLIDQILSKEILPIIVRTGTPQRFVNKFEDNNEILKIYAKGDTDFYEHIEELVEMNNSSIFKVFGTNGEVKDSVNQLFWKVIPQCFSVWGEEMTLNMPDKDKIIIRYISNWLINKYNYSENEYVIQDPLEMYMFPNNVKQTCTGDIYEKDDEMFIVLTPACDLANKKTENVLLSKIISHENVSTFFKHIESLQQTVEEERKAAYDKKSKSLSKWFRNGELPRYHFLPKVSFFRGGFVDFQQIVTVPYDNMKWTLADENYKRLGVLTDPFIKDVVSRFGTYYQRQGQPEFNSTRVTNYFL
jgi:CheY-like chemotaxis protein